MRSLRTTCTVCVLPTLLAALPMRAQSPNATPRPYNPTFREAVRPASATAQRTRAVTLTALTTRYPAAAGRVLPTPYYAHTEARPAGADLLQLYSPTDYIVTLGEGSGGLTRVVGGIKAADDSLAIGFCQPVASLTCHVSGAQEARLLLMPLADWILVPISGSRLAYTPPTGQKIAGGFLRGSPGLMVGPITLTP